MDVSFPPQLPASGFPLAVQDSPVIAAGLLSVISTRTAQKTPLTTIISLVISFTVTFNITVFFPLPCRYCHYIFRSYDHLHVIYSSTHVVAVTTRRRKKIVALTVA
jgi:hypothetical protein